MVQPIVTIQEGQLQGTTGRNLDGEDFLQFFGIPYAEPPVGELRFQVIIQYIILLSMNPSFTVTGVKKQ